MAAGIGSRYGGCKQIEGFGPGGEAILEYTAADARKAGFGATVVVLREEILDEFRRVVGRRLEARGEVRYAFQRLDRIGADDPVDVPAGRTKPWGTGHAVLAALPLVDAPFAVANTDDYYGPDAFRKLAAFLAGSAPTAPAPLHFCMVAYDLSSTLSTHGTVSRGLCTVDASGRLVGIREAERIVRDGSRIVSIEPDARVVLDPATPVSLNLWGLVPEVFPRLRKDFRDFLADSSKDSQRKEFYLPEAVGRLVRDGSADVAVLHSDDRWHGVTYPEDRAQVEEALTLRGSLA